MKAFLSLMIVFFGSFIDAKVHTTQKVRFIFNDKRTVDINLNNDALWKPKLIDRQLIKDNNGTEIFYYKPSMNYNYTAIESFRTLANSKNAEEIKSFWKNFFTLKFKEEYVNSADARDSLFDLIDATGAQNILLSGLILVIVPKDSVWRLKTIDNVRPLQNGDVQYLIIDNNYDSKAIELFTTLVNQKKQDDVAAFWEANKDLDEWVKAQLLEIIRNAEAYILLKAFEYVIRFTKNNKILADIPIPQEEMVKFNVLNELLKDLKSESIVPVNLDNTNLSIEVFKKLLIYISRGDGLYKNDKEVQEAIEFGYYMGLKETFLDRLFDRYIEHLMGYNFSLSSEVLNIFPSNLDLDKIAAQKIMKQLLMRKYHISSRNQESNVIKYNTRSTLSLLKVKLHQEVPYPYIFIRTVNQSYIAVPNTSFLLLSGAYYHQGVDPRVLDLEFFKRGADSVVLTDDAIKVLHDQRYDRLLLAGPQTIKELDEFKLPVQGITSGSIRLISNTRMCVGFANYIALFSINNNKIDNFESYKIPGSIGIVSNVFVLDDCIAISCDNGTYYFFDIKRKEFIEKPSNALKIKTADLNGKDVELMVLMRDESDCINRFLVMEARGFDYPPRYDYLDIFIDNEQKNIYMAFSKASPSAYVYSLIPPVLQSVIDVINNTEKALRGKEKRTSLTLDLLYYIAHKYSDMVKYPESIKKLENHVSAPMKAAINPTIWNKVKSSYFSLSDAFKRKFKWFAGVGVAGIMGYLYTKSRSGTVDMYAPGSSAAYGKLSISKGAQ